MHVQVDFVPERDAQGTIVSVLVITRDVTTSRELEERKDAFISMASHELKTPITALKGWTQLLQRRLEKHEVREFVVILEKMETQINRLTRLISELLDVSKIQAGRLGYAEEPVELDALVKEVVELLQSSNPRHTISLSGTIQAIVIGDRDRLEQVLINLITNAIKYSPHAEKVDVSLAAAGESVIVQVRDYGVGIPNDQLDKIFDRFYRVYDEKNTIFPGLGMGLYISSEIIKRHAGTITVESEEGRGSTFTVSLPIKRE
jgi:signal transduction histidine kinase